MSRTSSFLASLAILSAGLAGPLQANEDGDGAAPDQPPHALAPGQLNDLFITEADWIRARGEEWFEAQAEAGESRFSYSEEAVQITEDGEPLEGEFEAGWVDSQGEFELRYDEEEDELAYWQNVSASTLSSGRELFIQFCASCHGFDGAGYGRSAQHLRPPPRSFHQSTFKFTKVVSGYLPSDEALTTLVKRGLDGTPMMPWALSDTQLNEIIAYIKTLSPEGTGWRDVYAEIGDPVDIGEDPYAADPAEGVARGEQVYHSIQCYTCHPGYVTPSRLNELVEADPGTTYRDNLSYPAEAKVSGYEVLGHPVKILPPDFTFNTLRYSGTVREAAETVAAGIGGAGMPQWKDSIPDEDIWAIGHYVRHLVDEYKGQPAKRNAFMAELRSGN